MQSKEDGFADSLAVALWWCVVSFRPSRWRRCGEQLGRLIKRTRIGSAVDGEVDDLKGEVGYLGN